MLILHDASEQKLKELVAVSVELNKVLHEHHTDTPKLAVDNANVLKDALDEVIARRREQIDDILKTENSTKQEHQRGTERTCLE